MKLSDIKTTITKCEDCLCEPVCLFTEGKKKAEQLLIQTIKVLPTGILHVDATCEYFHKRSSIAISAAAVTNGSGVCTANMFNTGDVAKMTKDVKIELIGRMDV